MIPGGKPGRKFLREPFPGLRVALKAAQPERTAGARKQTEVISSPTALSGKGEVPGTVEYQQ